MKSYIYTFISAILIGLAACTPGRNIENSYADDAYNSVSYQEFYDNLTPYGQWIDNAEFGSVWAPRETGFQPYYSNGRWAYTNYGWTWVSDYNWGWATFHYGRWFYDNFYGWVWVPGYEWAPAWVSWRQNSDYYGWAPLCPRRRDGSYYEIRNDQWAFVPHQYINRSDLPNYYINRQNNTTVINNTTIINNNTIPNRTRPSNGTIRYPQGPNVADVERITRTKIRALPIKQSTAPGTTVQNGTLRIYNPGIRQNAANAGGSNAVPPKNTSPANQPQNNNGNVKIIPNRNVPQNPGDNVKNNNPALTGRNQTPADREQTDLNNRNTLTPSIRNNDGTLNTPDERRRRLQNYQQNTEASKNPGRIRQDGSDQNTLQNDNLNRVPPKRMVIPANPQANPRNNSNDQQQNPAVNQRTFKPVQSQPVERPSNSFERRPQAFPQNPSSNPNRENNNPPRQIRIAR